MRKGFWIVFLLSIELVSAQEVMIGGKSYSLLFISPLIVVGLIILFFLFSFLLKRISKVKLPSLKLKEKHISLFSKKEEKLGLGTVFDINKELEEFEKRAKKLETKEAFNELIGLLKDYLSYKLGMSKQFTFEEIEPILEKKAKKFVPLSKEIVHLRYSGKEINREEVNKLIDSFSRLARSEKAEKPKEEKERRITLFDKIDIKNVGLKNLRVSFNNLFKRTKEKQRPVVLGFKVKDLNIEVTRKHSKFNPVNVYYELKDYLEKRKNESNRDLVERLIRRGRRTVKRDWMDASRIYNKALGIYYKIPVSDEEKVAGSLIDLYGEVERAKLDEESKHMAEITEKIQGILEKQGIVKEEPEVEIVKHSHESVKHVRKSVLEWRNNLSKRVEDLKGAVKTKFKDIENDVEKDIHLLFIKPKTENKPLSHEKLKNNLRTLKVDIPKQHRDKLFTFELPQKEISRISNDITKKKIHAAKGKEFSLPILKAENPVLIKLQEFGDHIHAIEREGLVELKLRERELAKGLRAILHFHKRRHDEHELPIERFVLGKELQPVYDSLPLVEENKEKVNSLLMQKEKLLNKYKRAQIEAKKKYIEHLLGRIDDYERRRIDVIRQEIKKPVVKIRSKNVDELRKQEQDIMDRLVGFEKKKMEDIKGNIKESIREFEKEEHRIGKPEWKVEAERARSRVSRNVNALSKQEKELFNKLTNVQKDVKLVEPAWKTKLNNEKKKTTKDIEKLSKEQAKLFKKIDGL
ncbi:MAG: hypothetical protein PHT54_00375 [Candidatus Nanoarchaeia archaeon]|nr:hypothetical protein [Candidatus Nanoarchaeia archaeon]